MKIGNKSQVNIAKTLIIVAVFVLSSLAVNLVFEEPLIRKVGASDWWNNDWNYNKKITIDHTKVAGDLTNFPVLIHNISNDFVGHARSDGYDFRFLDSTNETEYYWELERYDSGTGELIAWVNITSLSASVDTVLYCYYGNASASSDPSSTSTWDNNFLAVFHMNEASGNIADSTSNSNDFTAAGTLTYQQTGKIGYGILGDDSSGYFSNTAMDLTDLSKMTIEAWYNCADGVGKTSYIFDSKYDASNDVRFNFYGGTGSNDNGFQAIWDDGTNEGCYDYTNSYTGFHYVVGAISNTAGDAYMYVDGSQSCTDDSVDFNFGDLVNVHSIGSRTLGTAHYFEGIIDEFRLSDNARTSNWISTIYNNTNSPSTFITVGGEQSLGWLNSAPTFSSESPTNASSGISLQPTVSVMITDADGNQSTCDFYTSTDGSSWTHRQTNTSVLNESISYAYIQADTNAITYYWKITADDTHDNSSAVYHFTTTLGTNVTVGAVNAIVNITGLTSNHVIRIYFNTSSGIDINDLYTYDDPSDISKGNRADRDMIILGLKNDTKYYYRVYDVTDSSWVSAEDDFTTLSRFGETWKDEFFDEYLIEANSSMEIQQQIGIKSSYNPLIENTNYLNMMRENSVYKLWGTNATDVKKIDYFTSSDGINWTSYGNITISSIPDLSAYGSIVNDSGVYKLHFRDINVGTYGRGGRFAISDNNETGTFNYVSSDPIYSSSQLNTAEEHISGFFNDTLGAQKWLGFGQSQTSVANRYIGRYIGFNDSDWIGFDADGDTYFLTVNVPRIVAGDQAYVFPVKIKSGCYVGFFHSYDIGGTATVKVYLAVSRDAWTWSYVNMSTEIIPLGAGGTWDDGMILADWNDKIFTEGDYDYIYYRGNDDVHGQGGTNRIGRIRFRKDGLTAMEPTSSGAWLRTTTIPSKYQYNFSINGNFSASASLNISVINASTGSAFSGFAFTDFDEITTNSTDITPTWSGIQLSGIPDVDFKLNFSWGASSGELYSYTITTGVEDDEVVIDITPSSWNAGNVNVGENTNTSIDHFTLYNNGTTAQIKIAINGSANWQYVNWSTYSGGSNKDYFTCNWSDDGTTWTNIEIKSGGEPVTILNSSMGTDTTMTFGIKVWCPKKLSTVAPQEFKIWVKGEAI